MTKTFSTDVKKETAVLVALINQSQPAFVVNEYLDELAFLAETSGAVTLKRFTQKLEKPDVAYFVGKGKLQEIIEFLEFEEEVEYIIFRTL